jgi:hypothetical protein
MSRPKEPAVRPRKIWRMSADAPHGQIVDSLPGALSPMLPDDADDERRQPAQANWRASSHDLSTGLEISDFSDTLPNDLYDDLFSAEAERRQ